MRLLLALVLLPAALSYPQERRQLLTTTGRAVAQPDPGLGRSTIVLEGTEASDLESSRAPSAGGTTGLSRVIPGRSRFSSKFREGIGNASSSKQVVDPELAAEGTGSSAADSVARGMSVTPGKKAGLKPAFLSTEGTSLGASEGIGKLTSSPESGTLPSIVTKTTKTTPVVIRKPSRQLETIEKASEGLDQESLGASPGQVTTPAPTQKPYSQPVTASRSRTGEAAARIINYQAENFQDGYQFQFQTTNGIEHEEVGKVFAGSLPGAALLTTEGRVSWMSPEGTQIVMHWHANEHGYQPRGEHIRSKHWHPHDELPPLEEDYPLLKSLRESTLKLVRFDEEIDEGGKVKKTPKTILRNVKEWRQALSKRRGSRGRRPDAELTLAQ